MTKTNRLLISAATMILVWLGLLMVSSKASNILGPTPVPLILNQAPGNLISPFQIKDGSGNLVCTVNPSGTVNCQTFIANAGGFSGAAMFSGATLLSSTHQINWTSTASYSDPADIGLVRLSAGLLSVMDGSSGTNFRDLKLRTLTTTSAPTVAGGASFTGDGLIWNFGSASASASNTININTNNAGAQLILNASAGGSSFGQIQSNTGNFFITNASGSGSMTFRTGNSTTHMVINSAGNLQLNAYGAGTLTTDASGNVTATSDERLKYIQRPFAGGLREISELRPIVYKWRPESKLDTEHEYAGFSAQQVKRVIPEAVGQDQNGHMTLQDRPIEAALVNAVRELSEQVNDLKRQVRDLKAVQH